MLTWIVEGYYRLTMGSEVGTTLLPELKIASANLVSRSKFQIVGVTARWMTSWSSREESSSTRGVQAIAELDQIPDRRIVRYRAQHYRRQTTANRRSPGRCSPGLLA